MKRQGELTMKLKDAVSSKEEGADSQDCNLPIDYVHQTQNYIFVHRCGASGSMHACHAAGTGSIPGRDKFSG